MRAPRLEGDSIPSMATTVEGAGGGERVRAADGQGPRPQPPSQDGTQGPGQMRLDEAPFSLGLPDCTLPSSLRGRLASAGVQSGAAELGLGWPHLNCDSQHTEHLQPARHRADTWHCEGQLTESALSALRGRGWLSISQMRKPRFTETK